MKHFNRVVRSALSVIVLTTASHTATAALIPADLSVSGQMEFSTTDSAPFSGSGSQTATFGAILAGTTTSSTVSNVTVTGANPQGGVLTDTGDGVFAETIVSGGADDAADDFIFDFGFALTNNSLTDSFELFFELVYSNSANADGTDAFIDSEINLFDASNTELFASDLTSDTRFGDSVNGNDPGTSGAALSDNGTFAFSFLLGAGVSDSFSGIVKLDGEEFDSNGIFSGMANASIRLVNVVNTPVTTPPPGPVPEPSTAWLFLAALAGVLRLNNKQR